MAEKMKNSILIYAVIAILLAGLAGCYSPVPSIPIDDEDLTSTVNSGDIWPGGNPTTPPEPSIALSFKWTPDFVQNGPPIDLTLQDGETLSWVVGSGMGANKVIADATAVLTDAPAGFEYLQWSFDPVNPVDDRRNSFSIGDGAGGVHISPSPSSIDINYIPRREETETIYVWNCNQDGSIRGTATAHFTLEASP